VRDKVEIPALHPLAFRALPACFAISAHTLPSHSDRPAKPENVE
jgi:hypothetical protein